MKQCVITSCNKSHLQKALGTIRQLKSFGGYDGDVVLLIGDDLKDIEINEDVIVKYYPTIDRSHVLNRLNGMSTSDGRDFDKPFQWHKIYAFDIFFKQWDKCLLLDAGMHVFKSIEKILNIDCINKIVAHSDSNPYTHYEASLEDRVSKVNLSQQFENSARFNGLYKELETRYDLYVDYFQTGLCLYDTNIISNDLTAQILEYGDKYINTRTNEQAIMNLIFNCEKKIWSPLPIRDDETYYYDYFERADLTYDKYIMLKYPRTAPSNLRLY